MTSKKIKKNKFEPGDLVIFGPPPATGLTSVQLYSRMVRRIGNQNDVGIIIDVSGQSSFVMFPSVTMWMMTFMLEKIEHSKKYE